MIIHGYYSFIIPRTLRCDRQQRTSSVLHLNAAAVRQRDAGARAAAASKPYRMGTAVQPAPLRCRKRQFFEL